MMALQKCWSSIAVRSSSRRKRNNFIRNDEKIKQIEVRTLQKNNNPTNINKQQPQHQHQQTPTSTNRSLFKLLTRLLINFAKWAPNCYVNVFKINIANKLKPCWNLKHYLFYSQATSVLLITVFFIKIIYSKQ